MDSVFFVEVRIGIGNKYVICYQNLLGTRARTTDRGAETFFERRKDGLRVFFGRRKKGERTFFRVAENSLLPWTARKNATPSFDILFNLDALIWNPCLAYAAKMQSSFFPPR